MQWLQYSGAYCRGAHWMALKLQRSWIGLWLLHSKSCDMPILDYGRSQIRASNQVICLSLHPLFLF